MGEKTLEQYLSDTNIFLIHKGLGSLVLLCLALVSGILLVYAQAQRHGYSLSGNFFTQDNQAVIVRTTMFVASFVIAAVCAYQPDASTLISAQNAVISIVFAVIALAGSFLVNDKIILRKIDNTKAVYGNPTIGVAVAILESTTFLATALIFVGGMANPKFDLIFNAFWFVVGQLILVTIAKIYSRVASTIYDKAVAGSAPCALSVAGFLLSGGMVVAAAIVGGFDGWANDIINVAKVVGAWLVLMVFVRALSPFIVNGKQLSDELSEDNNWSLGLLDFAITVVPTTIYLFRFVL